MQGRTPRRSGWDAGFLSLLAPGLGHLYAGHPKRGAVCLGATIVAAYALFPLARFDALSTSTYGVVSAVMLVIRAATLVDSVRLAHRAGSAYQLRGYNRWYAYVGAMVVVGLLLSPARLASRAYRIPSGAMLPTVQIGDRVVANLALYPRTPPSRGDVVVFRNPGNRDETYIKRIIGLPGETIAIHQRRVSVNGHELDDPWGFCPDGRALGDPSADCGPPIKIDEMAPVSLGADHYFLLGDNRMHSQDSRVWGAVPKADLLGKVIGVYWSWDPSRHRPRLDRIGRSLEPD